MRLPVRTFLYAPGNRPKLVQKVGTVGADAAILDLEDAVPIAEKEATRPQVREALVSFQTTPAWVRVNSLSTGLTRADLEAVVCPSLSGVVLPKAESAQDVIQVDRMIACLENERGVAPGSIEMFVIVETALGVVRAFEIASSCPRLTRVAFGSIDYALDVGIDLTKDGTEVQYPRAHVALAAHAAGIQPVDVVYADIQDGDGLRDDTLVGKRLGYQGKMIIHPNQVGPVNEIYSPTDDEVERAKRLIEAFAEAEAQGVAAISFEGKMVDYPVVKKAQRTVAFAQALAARSKS